MGWTASTGAGRRVAPQDTKICALCGALNHVGNSECFLCGWHGVFERNDAHLQMAWERLYREFEEVRLEHVTASGRSALRHSGLMQSGGFLDRLRTRLMIWWAGLDRRGRKASPRANTPPNGLGV